MNGALEHICGRAVILSVSGGKDSAAASLYLKELGIEHRRVFMDTGWEHDLTYEYLRGELTRVLGPIEEIHGERSMEALVRHKGMFPSRLRRFCTVELKVMPFKRFVEALDDDIVNVVGIRAAESEARSKMLEWERNDELDCDVWRPLIRWTLDDVIAIHRRHGLKPNQLYLMGASRVGCWPCIFARKSEIRMIAETDPARIDRLRVLENEVASVARARYEKRGTSIEAEGDFTPTFFVGKTIDARKSRFWPIDEAVVWSNTSRGGKQLEMFAPESADAGCMRWGMCETNGDNQ